MPPKKRMLDYVGCRVGVTTCDGDELCGRLLSFDRHGNLVLSDTEMVKRVGRKKTPQRTALGLLMIRGSSIVSITHEPSVTTGKFVNDSRQPVAAGEARVAAATAAAPLAGFR